MKKIKDFIAENWGVILVGIFVCFILGTALIPLFIGIGRIMWDSAINNPSAFM